MMNYLDYEGMPIRATLQNAIFAPGWNLIAGTLNPMIDVHIYGSDSEYAAAFFVGMHPEIQLVLDSTLAATAPLVLSAVARIPQVFGRQGSRGVATSADEAFFWSGRTDGVGGEQVAREIAESQGGTTLERLVEIRGIKMPEWNPNNAATVRAWEELSREYAKNASGTIRAVVGESRRGGSLWETVELPALMENANVTKIIVIDPATKVETVVFTR
jgi:hypothetical protein